MYRRALVAAALAVPLLPVGRLRAATSRLDRIVTSGRLRVGTTGDFRPMSFRDPATGEFAGYDIDLAAKLADDLGVKVAFVAAEWATLLGGLGSDTYDMTTSASITVERAKLAAFSLPSIEFGTVPMTLKDNLDQFDSWDSIDRPGISVAVMRNTVFDAQARAFFPSAEIRPIDGPSRDFQEVLAGHALVSLTNTVEAAALSQTYGELARVRVDEPRARRPGAFLLPREDQIWINFVDSWILMSRSAELFATLLRKWELD